MRQRGMPGEKRDPGPIRPRIKSRGLRHFTGENLRRITAMIAAGMKENTPVTGNANEVRVTLYPI